ncbi:hypothetical protein CAPTEDRAFT_218289 [Capitella teleta]|uniref:WSC domain-containing protein n=1 Tax=Capitella teleta TaxID=283909 RepID=R7U603_CAPTE|nr:hypothetical protein CAPTEDRAFT_218289 [Capitella teleta]|eukprot:ELT98585.1 hypothetical protein CAPTEDRAFT_218289 [Capitella teleta]
MAAGIWHFVMLCGLLVICECQKHGPFGDRYIGCYKDDLDRVLDIRVNEDSNYELPSVDECLRLCSMRGYTFAGTEETSKCYCGNNYDYDRYNATQNECTLPCYGNSEQTCGGDLRIQIYSVCPTGKYLLEGKEPVIDSRPNCIGECHCKSLPCLIRNGKCRDGCATGWRGDACNVRECDVDNGGCQHRCNENDMDKWCSCDEGFQIASDDWRKCVVTLKIRVTFRRQANVYSKKDTTTSNIRLSFCMVLPIALKMMRNNLMVRDVTDKKPTEGITGGMDGAEGTTGTGGTADIEYTTGMGDPSSPTSTNGSNGIIPGIVAALLLLLLLLAVVATVCFIKRRRKAERNAYTSTNVPDAEKMESNEYEELRDKKPREGTTRDMDGAEGTTVTGGTADIEYTTGMGGMASTGDMTDTESTAGTKNHICYRPCNDSINRSFVASIHKWFKWNHPRNSCRSVTSVTFTCCSCYRVLHQKTKAGSKCYCGNNYDYDRYNATPNECTLPCNGNSEQTCGGDLWIQIYSVCPTGKYLLEGKEPVIDSRPNCNGECHCKGLPCLFRNGKCRDGCATGWRGDACNERECDVDNGGCQHQCNENDMDKWCSCDEGFQIASDDWRKCVIENVSAKEQCKEKILAERGFCNTFCHIDEIPLLVNTLLNQYVYQYAGSHCYCGNNYDYDRYGATPNECTLLCNGNSEQTCGGDLRIQIYSVCPTGKYLLEGDERVIDSRPNCNGECHCKADNRFQKRSLVTQTKTHSIDLKRFHNEQRSSLGLGLAEETTSCIVVIWPIG